MVRDDDIGAGTLETDHCLHHDTLVIDQPFLTRVFQHRVLTADIVDRQRKTGVLFDIPDDVLKSLSPSEIQGILKKTRKDVTGNK